MLSLLVPEHVVGWFGAAFRFFDMLMFFPSILSMAVFPVLSRSVDQKNAVESTTIKSLEIILMVAIPLAIATYAFAGDIITTLFGAEDYTGSIAVLAALAPGLVLVYIDFVLVTALIAMDRQRQWSWVALAAIPISIGLNALLIPYFQDLTGNGGIGSAIATNITELGILVTALVLLPRGFFPRKKFQQPFRTVVAGALLILCIWGSSPSGPLVAAGICRHRGLYSRRASDRSDPAGGPRVCRFNDLIVGVATPLRFRQVGQTMKILNLIPYVPVPPTFGGGLRVYHLLRWMTHHHDVHVIGYGTPDDARRLQEAIGHPAEKTTLIPGPQWFDGRWKRIGQLYALLRNTSFTEIASRSRMLQSVLDQHLEREEFDLIQIAYPVMGYFTFASNAVRVLDAANVEYDIHRRVAQSSESGLRRWWANYEYRKLYPQEVSICREQDAIFLTSDRDKELLDADLPEVPKFIIPNGVDTDY
jgi:hypothetical protein